eukprot:4699308-Pyramimonas_sp.AAC.1
MSIASFPMRRAFLDGDCATSFAPTVEHRLVDQRRCSGQLIHVGDLIRVLRIAWIEEEAENAER